MNNNGDLALELAKNLESFVQQQSMLIHKIIGIPPVVATPVQSVSQVHGITVNTGMQFDSLTDAQISAKESSFGEEMSEAELARQFGEKVTVTTKRKKLKEMTKAEIDVMPLDQLGQLVEEAENDERLEDSSTDIYKIKARVANLARESGGVLTAQGEGLCNSYTHVLKALYDFAAEIQDPTTRVRLIQLIRHQESMPGTVIAAAGAGVRTK
jgi:hypothetical protein